MLQPSLVRCSYNLKLNGMRSKRNGNKPINAGSMADIAFLLLVFFLVTTTMDAEVGLNRKLPPNEDSEGQVLKRNVFNVLVNKKNEILAQNQPVDVAQLQDMAVEFIENHEDREDLPEKVLKDVPGIGSVMVSKQVISLQNDVHTSYGTYVAVQDALAAAYLEARNNYAQTLYGETYSNILSNGDAEKVEAIRTVIPQRISEAEPVE